MASGVVAPGSSLENLTRCLGASFPSTSRLSSAFDLQVAQQVHQEDRPKDPVLETRLQSMLQEVQDDMQVLKLEPARAPREEKDL